MKKVFPAIIVLIALSLMGIIALQVSWLSNLLQVQRQKLSYKIERSAMTVAQELGKGSSLVPFAHLHGIPNTPLMPNSLTFTFEPGPTIAQRYSAAEIEQKMRAALEKENIHDLSFEFGVTSNSDEWILEMRSKDFETAYADTLHNKRVITPVFPANINGNLPNELAYENLFIIVPNYETQVWKSLTWVIAVSFLFTLIIIAAFSLTIKTMLSQQRLNKIKSDFINNMTHEFKTPLATISLAVDALQNPRVQSDMQKQTYFSGVIKEENKKMNKHVETILEAAVMERQNLKLHLKPLHAHAVIKKVVDSFALQLEDKQGAAVLHLFAKNDLINADEVHFTALVSNLIDNAIKYSTNNLLITITTSSTAKHLVIQVADNGIGMSKETVKRIFEKFFRAHTGNLHNVKGFGLGMSYVKSVVDGHKARIRVESALGKGSTFTVEMLLAKKEDLQPENDAI